VSHKKYNPKGPIAWMANNSVAANLLMAVVLIAGFVGLTTIKQEVFPEFDLDVINVSVVYPGASPADVEQGIVLAVEESLRGLEGVKRVTSTSGEGVGVVSLELLLEAKPDKVLSDAKSAVDRIASFPEEAERPQVTLATRKVSVVKLIVSSENQDFHTLHAIAERARERLISRSDITQVEVNGVPPLEVHVEVDRSALERYGLSLDDVALQIKRASLDLPAGAIDTAGGELLVRVDERKVSGKELEDVDLIATRTGARVKLRDVATVRDDFADNDLSYWFDGQRAIRLTAYRVGSETPTSVSAAVHAVRAEMLEELPPDVELAIWDDDSKLLESRIDLLVRNARIGLVLVLIVLALFLNLELAAWVAVGIPVSFLGAFALMPHFGVSINMVSLFGLIVTLGMVVDDAIIIGENFHEYRQQGYTRKAAAIRGAQEMSMPVTFAILTTVVAFSPMLAVPGVMGKIFHIMPIVVISVLTVSLLESFFVLPAHLAHDGGIVETMLKAGLPESFGPRTIVWGLATLWRNTVSALPIWGWAEAVQARVTALLDRFIAGVYLPVLTFLTAWRYATVASGFGMFVLSVSLVASGLLPFSFFPKLEGNVVRVNARMPYGAPAAQADQVRRVLEASARQALKQTTDQDVLNGMMTLMGEGPAARMAPGGGGGTSGSHLLTIELELVPAEEREVTSKQIADAWAAATPPLAGLEVLSFESNVGPGAGAAVAVQLASTNSLALEQGAAELTETLRAYPQLMNLENGWVSGKPQLEFHLLPEARNYGLTTFDIARQVRSSFFGAEAVREQRGRNEVKVMVRLPEDQRISEFDLDQLRIRTPMGGYVPLEQVATFERTRSPTSIVREDGVRVVEVKAELAPGLKSARPVLEDLEENVYPGLLERHPDLRLALVGNSRSQAESMGALMRNAAIALVLVFALLAIPVRSYLTPLVIMSAIPMGFVGAVIGHVVMGYELSFISGFGIVALAGVSVNDSLVMVDAAEQRRKLGDDPRTAVFWAGTRRMRPILLTSLTTFLGLAPMIMERSVQARFLVPMAISLGYGILFTTVVTLFMLPALYLVVEDVRAVFGLGVDVEDMDHDAAEVAAG